MASQNITLSKETELELLKFKNPRTAQQGGRGASQAEYEQLRAVLRSSDKIAHDVHLAITSRFPNNQAYMQGFFINPNLKQGVHAAFSSATKEIGFNPNSINGRTRADYYHAIMTTAHELQHALDKTDKKSLNTALKQQVVEINGIRDYTDETENWILKNREWEARAEINGFNAAVEALRRELGGRTPTLEEIFNTSDDMENFIERTKDKNGQEIYSWRTHPNPKNHNMSFQPNADMTLDLNNPTNQEMIASRFYDNTNYPSRVAADAISTAIDIERYIHHENGKVHVNMQTLAKYGVTPKGLQEGLQENGFDLNQIVDISSPSFLKSQQQSTQQHSSNQQAIDEYTNRFLNKYAAIREAHKSGNQEAIRAAQQDLINQSPTAQATLTRMQSELAQRRQEKAQEAQAYSWDNLPEKAQILNQQIKQHLKAYYQEQNFPYTERGINNRAAALTAAAYAQRMPRVDGVHINSSGELVAVHHTFYGGVNIATTNSEQALMLPERESFKQIMHTEQGFAQEAQQREYEKQMERGQGISR